MKIVLPIDPFQLTQEFGVNAAAYKRFGLAGHNGWDIRTIYPDTPGGRRNILAMQAVEHYRNGNEGNDGFGLYTEVITRTSKSIWKHTLAHCHSIETFTRKQQGETMAISDNSGNSSAPHLHWTVKRIKINPDKSHTVINYNNGFFGAVNPQEYINEVRADAEPVITPMNDDQTYKKAEYDRMVTILSQVKDEKDQPFLPSGDSRFYKDKPEMVSQALSRVVVYLMSNKKRAGIHDALYFQKLKLGGDSGAVDAEFMFAEILKKAGSRKEIRKEFGNELIEIINKST